MTNSNDTVWAETDLYEPVGTKPVVGDRVCWESTPEPFNVQTLTGEEDEDGYMAGVPGARWTVSRFTHPFEFGTQFRILKRPTPFHQRAYMDNDLKQVRFYPSGAGLSGAVWWHSIYPEENCLLDHDTRLSDSEARALWDVPSNPNYRPEPVVKVTESDADDSNIFVGESESTRTQVESDSEWSKLTQNEKNSAIGEAIGADMTGFGLISHHKGEESAKTLEYREEDDEYFTGSGNIASAALNFLENRADAYEIELIGASGDRYKISRIS